MCSKITAERLAQMSSVLVRNGEREKLVVHVWIRHLVTCRLHGLVLLAGSYGAATSSCPAPSTPLTCSTTSKKALMKWYRIVHFDHATMKVFIRLENR